MKISKQNISQQNLNLQTRIIYYDRFLPGFQSQFNFRQLMKSPHYWTVVLSTDTENTFDKTLYPFQRISKQTRADIWYLQ